MSLTRFVKRVACLSPRASVLDASREMQAQGIGTIVVVSDDYRPLGLVTDRDVVVRVVAAGKRPEATTLEAVMSTPVASLGEGASLETVTDLMRDRGIRRIVVLDENARVTGIVTLDDMLLLLGTELGDLAGAIFGNLAAAP